MTGLASVTTMALVGLDGHPIAVQAHIGSGLVNLIIVGLPDLSVRESKDRVRAALQSCGLDLPHRRVTVNLSPAGLPKGGSGFDLAIALAVLAANGQLEADRLAGIAVLAELGVDGALHSVPGVLPAMLSAREAGLRAVLVSESAATEARLVPGIDVVAFSHLADVVLWAGSAAPVTRPALISREPVRARRRGARLDSRADLSDVRGQDTAKGALQVAAAGRHHIMLTGSPGAGKTMLAARLPGILPDLSDQEAVQVTALHSVAGQLDASRGLLRRPQFQAPHHTATTASIVGGGGSRLLRPGAASLAHAGVLFLDEAPEFRTGVLDALRQPLEEGRVLVHRARAQVEFPARFQLVLACNPCPCGSPKTARTQCRCTSIQRRRYRSRLSGPLMDRIDITVEMTAPTRAELAGVDSDRTGDTATARGHVDEARRRAAHRLRGTPWRVNADVPGRFIRQHGLVAPRIVRHLEGYVAKGTLTMRGLDRVLRMALTVADLDGSGTVGHEHVKTAQTLRTGAFNG